MKLFKMFLLLALVGTVAFTGYTSPVVKESPPDEVSVVSHQDIGPVLNIDMIAVPDQYAAELATAEKAFVLSAPDPFRYLTRRQYTNDSRWCHTKTSKGYIPASSKVPLRNIGNKLAT